MNLMHVPPSAPTMPYSEEGKKEGERKERIGKSVIIKK